MKRDKSYYFLITGIFIAAALFLSLLCKVGSRQNVRITQTRNYEEVMTLQEDAYEKKQDGTSPSGVIHAYSLTIPDTIEHETCLGFYLFHQYASVSIDGECVYRIEPSGKLPMIKTPGYNWVTIPIYEEDRGKCLQVEVIPVYEGSDDEQTSFLLGPKHRIIIEQLRFSWTKLTICELLIFIGITLIIFAIYYWRKYKTGTELIALGLTAILMGIWRYTDSRFTPMIAPERPVFLFLVSFSCMMMGMIPLMLSQKKMINETIRRVYEGVVAIACLFAITLQWFGITEVRNYIVIFHIIALIGFLIILISAIGMVKSKKKKLDLEIVSMVVLVIGAVLDGYFFYVHRTEARTIYLLWSLIFYILVSAFTFMVNFAEQKQQMAIQEKQLINSRISSMMGQIRSHFIFNILNAISGMCKYDPEKADETIVCFARYLRTNINIMYDDNPVPFTVALGHLEDYIALEQVRFGDRIRFEEEIEVEDFVLPSLVMQPLVENAVKHGILPKGAVGTVKVHTWQSGNMIYIAIEDDGVGFDTELLEKNSQSVGIKNVRLRLKYILGGELTIESCPGKGTKALIVIDSDHPIVYQEKQEER